MAKHHPDLIFCRKQAGVAIGRLCEKCDGRCVICDSYVRPCTLVRIYSPEDIVEKPSWIFFPTWFCPQIGFLQQKRPFNSSKKPDTEQSSSLTYFQYKFHIDITTWPNLTKFCLLTLSGNEWLQVTGVTSINIIRIQIFGC